MKFDFNILLFGIFSLCILTFFLLIIYERAYKYNHVEIFDLEIYCKSIIYLIIILSIIGLLICFINFSYRRYFLIFLMAIIFIYFYSIYKNGLKLFASKELRIVIAIQYSAIIFLLLIASVNFNLKRELIDGPYVNKNNTVSTRIQYFSGDLPADNVIPFVVQEYMANNISFANNDPVLPGQSVSNRPILLSLASLPIRTLLRPALELTNLPKFMYLGQSWPDFRELVKDQNSYAIFLGISIFLNSCLFVICALFAIKFYKFNCKLLLAFGFLYWSSPYMIVQTIFAWPKCIAGFFILTSIFNIVSYKKFFISGVLMGMGYLFHPYTISYLIISTAVYLYFYRSIKSIYIYITGFLLAISPWFIWTKLYIKTPPDLIEQNFRNFGSFYNFLSIRLNNLVNLFTPTHLLNFNSDFISHYPSMGFNYLGAVGIVIFSSALILNFLPPEKNFFKLSCIKDISHPSPFDASKKILLILTFSCLLITCVFSYAALPLAHGFQPLIAFALLIALYQYSLYERPILIFAYIQIIINLILLFFYILTLLS